MLKWISLSAKGTQVEGFIFLFHKDNFLLLHE